MATSLMKVIDSLNCAAIDYVVVGGLAVGAHGHPRATDQPPWTVVDVFIDHHLRPRAPPPRP